MQICAECCFLLKSLSGFGRTVGILSQSRISQPFHFRPRTYPPLFGKKLARLHRLFCKKKCPPKAVDPDVVGAPLIPWFKSLEWGDMWDDGNLYSCLSWLRGSQHLNLGEWRDAFPRKIQ